MFDELSKYHNYAEAIYGASGEFAYRFIHGQLKGYTYEGRSQTQGGKESACCEDS
jgi:hypothetical protein